MEYNYKLTIINPMDISLGDRTKFESPPPPPITKCPTQKAGLYKVSYVTNTAPKS